MPRNLEDGRTTSKQSWAFCLMNRGQLAISICWRVGTTFLIPVEAAITLLCTALHNVIRIPFSLYAAKWNVSIAFPIDPSMKHWHIQNNTGFFRLVLRFTTGYRHLLSIANERNLKDASIRNDREETIYDRSFHPIPRSSCHLPFRSCSQPDILLIYPNPAFTSAHR